MPLCLTCSGVILPLCGFRFPKIPFGKLFFDSRYFRVDVYPHFPVKLRVFDAALQGQFLPPVITHLRYIHHRHHDAAVVHKFRNTVTLAVDGVVVPGSAATI